MLLLVEVADSSASFDRRRKVPVSLAAGIPGVWLVDLDAAAVEVHMGETVRTVPAGDTLAPQAFPDIVIEASELLI